MSERRWIPTDRRDGASEGRTIVLCFDGTGNQFSDENSNVLQFFKSLRKDSDKQLVYYQTGIGTYTNPAFVTTPVIEASMALDAAIGWNLENHVHDAYRFLMQHYKQNDRISLFGFSRGAYTARVLLGFVQKVGLLPAENHAQIPFAWNVFKCSDEKTGSPECESYKKAFSLDVNCDFIGVWETVASLGISGRELPFASVSSTKKGGVRVFRQALALDERRAKFVPNFKLRIGPNPPTGLGIAFRSVYNIPPLNWDADVYPFRFGAPFREVWFAGCHCDVGGGSISNDTHNSLARIPLRWMIRECFRTDTGIIFDKDILQQDFGLHTESLSYSEDPEKIREQRLSGVRHAIRRRKTMPFYHFLWVLFRLLWDPLAWLFFLLLSVLTYPLKLIRHSKYFKVTFAIPHASTGPITGTIDMIHALMTENRLKRPRWKSEEEEELKDALSPAYDQLSMIWFWWIFEIWPIIFRLQDSRSSRRELETRINFGRGREIYGDAWNQDPERKYIEVHRSVLTRMESDGGYRPRAWFRVPFGEDFHWRGELDRWEYPLSEREGGWGMIRWVD